MDKDISGVRKELKNIRQQVEKLKYVYKKDVDEIKELLQTKCPQTSLDEQKTTILKDGTDEEASAYQAQPIGYIESVFKYKNGTPRQPGVCHTAKARLTILKNVFNNPEHSLQGLEEFSHVWVLFIFHKNNNVYTKAKVKPPRLNGRKVGLFSTRCPYRPNPIGLTLAKVDKIEGPCIHLSDVDILDGTPVLDIKPYIPQYDQPTVSQTEFSSANFVKSRETGWLEQGDCEDTNWHDVNIEDTPLSAEQKVREVSSRGPETDSHKEKGDMFIDRDMSVDNTWSNSGTKINPFTLAPSVVCPDNNLGDFEKSMQPSDAEDNSFHIALTAEGIVCEKFEKCEETREKLHKINCALRVSESMLSAEDGHLGSVKDSDTEASQQRKSTGKVSFANWIASPPVQKLQVRFTATAEKQLQKFSPDSNENAFKLRFLKSPTEAMKSIKSILEADPRSTYRRNRCVDSLYYFTVDNIHVTCWFDDDTHDVEVVKIKPMNCVPHLVTDPRLKN